MAIIVHSHKEVERYEVSADTKGLMESLKKNLINNRGMELKKEWMDLYEGEVQFFAVFESISKDLLDD